MKTNIGISAVLMYSLGRLEARKSITPEQAAWWKEIINSAGLGRVYSQVEMDGCLAALSGMTAQRDALCRAIRPVVSAANPPEQFEAMANLALAIEQYFDPAPPPSEKVFDLDAWAKREEAVL